MSKIFAARTGGGGGGGDAWSAEAQVRQLGDGSKDNALNKMEMGQDITSLSVFPPQHDQQPSKKMYCRGIEFMSTELWRAVFCECLATAAYLYINVLNIASKPSTTTSAALIDSSVLEISFCFGFSIMVLVYAFAGVSGAHINPAVTLGLAVTRKVSIIRAFLYIAAQLVGAVMGTSLAKYVNDDGFALNPGLNAVPATMSDQQALVCEAAGTGFLVMVVYSAIDDMRYKKVPHLGAMAPIAIGGAVFLAHLCMIPLTGCSINPARSIGPMVVEEDYDDIFVFTAGPAAGAIIAAILYELLFKGRPSLDMPSELYLALLEKRRKERSEKKQKAENKKMSKRNQKAAAKAAKAEKVAAKKLAKEKSKRLNRVEKIPGVETSVEHNDLIKELSERHLSMASEEKQSEHKDGKPVVEIIGAVKAAAEENDALAKPVVEEAETKKVGGAVAVGKPTSIQVGASELVSIEDHLAKENGDAQDDAPPFDDDDLDDL